MPTVPDFLKFMLKSLDRQREDIGRFHLINRCTATELYRTQAFSEQLKHSVERLEKLLVEYDQFNKKLPGLRSTKEYAQLVNTIMTEMQILKSTDAAMKDHMNILQKSDHAQHQISGQVLHLKKKISKAIAKTEKILRFS